MKADSKTGTVLKIAYINMSEQLRKELELKIESVYEQTHFYKYKSSHIINYQNVDKEDFLCAYLIGKVPGNYALSGRLLQGIRIWFNMYYDDRLSVIDKFRRCYQKAETMGEPEDKPGVTIVFCKFLINELLSILAESRWQLLINHVN